MNNFISTNRKGEAKPICWNKIVHLGKIIVSLCFCVVNP